MSWLTIALVVLGLVAAIQLLTGFNFSRILFLPGSISPVPKEAVADATRKELVKAAQRLIKHGFKPASWVRRTPLIRGQQEGFSGVLLQHEKAKMWALVLREQPGMSLLDWRMYLLSVNDDGVAMVTGNLETTTGLDDIAGLIFHRCSTLSPNQQLKEHFELSRNFKSVKCSRNDAMEHFELAYFQGLIQSGKLSKSKKGFRYPLIAAVKEVREHNRLRQEITKLEEERPNLFLCTDPKSGSGSIRNQVLGYQHYQTLHQQEKLGWLAKTALLLVSVALFGLVFGLTLSPEMALMLIAVLFIHEIGHLLAMWMFGYKDLSMLFIPFLGALAKGNKDRPSPWQEAVVLLMGPLPGYVGGIFLFQNAEMFPEWVAQFALLAIILNLINLLPFMPLDGGRIVSLALFSRRPALQFVVHFISILFFVFLWFSFGEVVGLALAFLLTIALPHLWREMKFLRHLLRSEANASFDGGNLEQVVAKLNAHPDWQTTPASERFSMLDSLKLKLQHATVSASACFGIFAVWILSIVAPPLSVVEINDLKMVAAAFGVSSNIAEIREDWTEAELRYSGASDEVMRLDAAIDLSAMQYAAEFDETLEASYYWNFAKEVIETAEVSDHARINYLMDMAPSCKYFNEDCGSDYTTRAVEMANALTLDDPRAFNVFYRLAMEDFLEAELQLHFAAMALVVDPDLNDNARAERLIDKLAALYEESGDVGQAETALRRGLEIAEELGDEFNIDRKTKRLAMFYRRHFGRDRAMEFLEPLIPKSSINQSSLMENTTAYVAVWIMAETEPEEALELLLRIDAATPAAAIELNLAEFHLLRLLGRPRQRTLLEISQWFAELPEGMPGYGMTRQLLGSEQAEESRDELERNWYASLRSVLELPDLAYLNDRLSGERTLLGFSF